MSQDQTMQKIVDVLNSHQRMLELAQEHLHALYASQQFLISTMLEASPTIKERVTQALDQVLGQPDLAKHPTLLQTLLDLKKDLQRPAALTPEERRSRLYLAWPPKTAPPEDEDR